MNITILGMDSLLGVELQHALRISQNHKVQGLSVRDLALDNPQEVRNLLQRQDLVLNCHEYNDIDGAELSRKEAYLVNIDGVRNLGLQCNVMGIRLIHFSSGYVFDGTKEGRYTERDIPNPINIYGSSKFIAEKELRAQGGDYLIIRLSSLYGRRRHPGHFLADLLKRLDETRDRVPVMDDQLVAPTFAADLAEVLVSALETPKTGLLHAAPSESCTWYEFAQYALAELGRDPLRIEPCPSSKLGFAARRPTNLVLDSTWFERWTGRSLPGWRDGLHRALS